jgi:hypothetical protein
MASQGHPAPEDPGAPPPLHVVDGIILDGGFDLFLREPLAYGVHQVDTVHPAEARARWGSQGAGGAIVYTREGGLPEGPTLRRLLEHHLGFLEALVEADPRPTGGAGMSHPPEQLPPWARLLVLVDGEIMLRPPSVEHLRPHATLPPDPPADWLHPLGNEPTARIEIRAARGEGSGRLYGTRAWFGVIVITTEGA